MQRVIALVIIVGITGGLIGAVALNALSSSAGAEPACPGNPNPPPRCRSTPTPTATATATPSATATATATATPTVTPTPVPPSNDVLLAYDVLVADHTQKWFGAYQPAACEAAVIFIGASATQGFVVSPTYDILIASSADGVTPITVQNIGNSVGAGRVGSWITTRRVSDGGTSDGYNEPLSPYVLVGVFANDEERFVSEVHCARTYP